MNSGQHQDSSIRNVLIFRTTLLSYSETFIPSQAEKFETFKPLYVGLKQVSGVPLPPLRTFVAKRNLIAKLPGWNALFGPDQKFVETLRQKKPALMHAHFEDGGLAGMPLAQRLQIPLVVTCHGYDVSQSAQGWKSWPLLRQISERRRTALLPKFALCIGISKFICDQMLKRGYPSEKVRLHYIGVDVDRFQPDPSVAKEPVILFVGRLVEKKGCVDLLSAMQKVNAKYPEIKLKLVGTGPLLKTLKKMASETRINVEFCGVRPPKMIQKTLQTALLHCIPSVRASHGDSEGLGIVNLEAQASGVPVIGTRHGGIPESVEDGVTGLLSPERDPDALAANILTLLSDSPLREKMGAAGRQRMVQHFNLQHQSGLLEKMYLEII